MVEFHALGHLIALDCSARLSRGQRVNGLGDVRIC